MARRLSKRKLPDRDVKRMNFRSKIESSVFDRHALLILSDFLGRGTIRSLDYPISTGKEADVFRATTDDGFLAVKIFRIETSNFQNMQDYIIGDPRFKDIMHTKREIIFAWARKEYRNLTIANVAGVNAPRPVAVKDNVLLMEFLGEEGVPDSTLKQEGSERPEEDCDKVIGMIRKLYVRGLVHGDVSEYNILMHNYEPYLIDFGQGVVLAHNKSAEFLRRDVQTVLKYFGRQGVKRDLEETIRSIIPSSA